MRLVAAILFIIIASSNRISLAGSRAFVLTGAARRRSRGHGKDKRAKPSPLTRFYLQIPYGAGLAGD